MTVWKIQGRAVFVPEKPIVRLNFDIPEMRNTKKDLKTKRETKNTKSKKKKPKSEKKLKRRKLFKVPKQEIPKEVEKKAETKTFEIGIQTLVMKAARSENDSKKLDVLKAMLISSSENKSVRNVISEIIDEKNGEIEAVCREKYDMEKDLLQVINSKHVSYFHKMIFLAIGKS